MILLSIIPRFGHPAQHPGLSYTLELFFSLLLTMHLPSSALAWLLPWLCFVCFNVRPCSAADVDALMELKKGFNNPKRLASWNINSTGAPCLGWRGITCQNVSNRPYVVDIYLPKVSAGGEISPAIRLLTHLQTINLSRNRLTGTIPSQITNLKNLTILNLSYNNLSGNLQLNWGSLTQLTDLILAGNSFHGAIPSTIAMATSLKKLRLERNNLTGEIPSPIFADLSQLRYFAIEYNDLTGPIPEEICNCTTLRSVYASHNRLSGRIPAGIGELTRLLHFEVEVNYFSGLIPESLGRLTNSLSTLNLSQNNFSGPIPPPLAMKFNDSSFADNPYLCGGPGRPPCSSGWDNPNPRGGQPNGAKGEAKAKQRLPTKIIEGVVGGVGGACIVLLVIFLLFRRTGGDQNQDQDQNWFNPEMQENRRHGRFEMFSGTLRCTYDQIVYNAGHYDTAHVLGKGRFATVYKSVFPNETQLAVKVFKHGRLPASFERDIELLASIRHPNVLPIRGIYSNPMEKAIFYDYLPLGTLYGLLHGEQSTIPSALPDWATRQRIALGIAQALAYLHRGSGLQIVHKDVKSTNILLETGMLPQLSDIALVQLVSSNPQEVVVTPGYTAPEVLIIKKYTEKSDVYSFGVVFLELITGKEAVSYTRESPVNLTEWVTRLHGDGRGREVYDDVAANTCPLPIYIEKALDLAMQCVNNDPGKRPIMSEVAATIEGLGSVPSPLRSPGDTI